MSPPAAAVAVALAVAVAELPGWRPAVTLLGYPVVEVGNPKVCSGRFVSGTRRPCADRKLRLAAVAAPEVPPVTDAWFGADKVRHLVLAAHVQGVAFAAATLVGLRPGTALGSSIGIAGAVSFGKEVHDRRAGGRFSWRDLAWDAAGVALATTVLSRVGYE